MGKLVLIASALLALPAWADVGRFMCSDPFRTVKITDRTSFYSFEIGEDHFKAWEVTSTYSDKHIVWKENDIEKYTAVAHLKRVDGKGFFSVPTAITKPDGSIEVLVFCYDDKTVYP